MMTQQNKSADLNCALVIGASGGLGQALVEQLLSCSSFDKVIAISRSSMPVNLTVLPEAVHWLMTDYSEPSMSDIAQQLAPYQSMFQRVFICNGILHNNMLWPEKRLDDLNQDALHELFQINAVIPVLWLKWLRKIVAGKQSCVVAVFSARIGSIGDNRLGGWYSYRASKASLNMLLKTAAIEYARCAKNVKLIAFHPGTTDTQLSKPFHASVPNGNLLSPEYVAKSLLSVMDDAEFDGELSYLDWENKGIVW